MAVLYVVSIVCFLLLCLVLCGVILMQESKGGGLGASLGGGDASNSVFGTSTADVLKRFTAYLVGIFFLSCIVLSFWTSTLGKQEAQVYDIEQID